MVGPRIILTEAGVQIGQKQSDNELSQSDSEFSNIQNCYKISDSYETTDNECLNNELAISSKKNFKKKRIHSMNLKTIIEKQAELAYHPDVLEILSLLCVRCRHCKKPIKLKRGFEKSCIESHMSNVSNSQQEPHNKKYPCIGLCEEKHLAYIERVCSFIVFGEAPPVKEVAQELFPRKFMKETKFSYTKLISNESKKLNEELSARSKWKIDQECLFFHTKDNDLIPFWLKLAKKGSSRAFESKPAFKGLCEVMIQIAQHKDYSKGIQNLKYSEDFTHFTAVLSSLSPKAYEFFRTNLAGQTLQHIRLLRQKSGEFIYNTDICFENIACFKQLADSMNYNGPVIAMTDNTKLHPRLGYFANLGYLVENYDEVKPIIQNIISNKAIAKQVRLYLLQWPSDDDLLRAIHEGYQQAWNFAKILSMNDDYYDYFSSTSQNSDVSDSQAIAIAADVVINSNSIGICDDDIEEDLRDARLENHESYNSQCMEQKTICETQQFNYTNSIHPNIVSSMIANCTSNLGILQGEKLHEIC
ncbi:37123_t:CDS:10 [Gigaspora margarita]|uniref:37123_t:CDS:1 n=1 Tax=Gigaspora margarita TaxID=4874 RepID=A0ABN7V5X4_GIGMA|nr:37123_t:CDS:10 [Gigaspora margarita]